MQESPRTTTARAAALRWLATQTQAPAPPPLDPGKVLEPATPWLAQQLRSAITAWANTGSPVLLRTAAAAAITASTAATTDDLVALRVKDMDIQPGHIDVPATELTPLPSNFQTRGTSVAAARLLPWAVPVVRAWLAQRKVIVDRLEGSDPGQVLVTCHPNRRHSPPGMPLSLRGLTASYVASVRKLQKLDPHVAPPATLALARRVALSSILRSV